MWLYSEPLGGRSLFQDHAQQCPGIEEGPCYSQGCWGDHVVLVVPSLLLAKQVLKQLCCFSGLSQLLNNIIYQVREIG